VPDTIIAVPFWGVGAINRLGIDNRSKARIICNLRSTACNPYVIADLNKLKGVKLRSHPRLHAKIYAAKTFCIIGSSNASTNGLGLEGTPLKSWIEANVLSNDSQLTEKTLDLFEEIWSSKECTRISLKSLRAAKLAWDNRPKPPPATTKPTTLLAACRENSALCKSVFVAAYEDGLGKEAASKLRNLTKRAVVPERPNESDVDASDFRKAWGYQFKGIVPRSWLIDLDCRKLSKAKIRGCAQATGLCFKIKDEHDLAIALRGSVRSPDDGRRLHLSAAEKNSLERNARRILKLKPAVLGRPVPLHDVFRCIDPT
jgi:hypothetical protein